MIIASTFRARSAPAVLAGIALASVAAAGNLAPPPGPVGPTMKPLDAIEPRVCVNELPGAPDAVHVISAPGNYYLTADIVAGAGLNGIVVSAEDVTLDLNGFSLRGLPGSLDGILVDRPGPPASEDVFAITGRGTVATGKIETGVLGFDGNGVHVVNTGTVNAFGLSVRACGGDGIRIIEALSVDLGSLDVTGCGGDGIYAKGDKNQPLEDFSLKFCKIRATYSGARGLNGEDFREYDISEVFSANNGGDGVRIVGTLLTGASSPDQVNANFVDVRGIANGGDGLRFEFDDTAAPLLDIRRTTSRGNAGAGLNTVPLAPDLGWQGRLLDLECSENGNGGAIVRGDLQAHNVTCSGNTGDGLAYQSDISPRKRKISVEALICVDNTGNGAAFSWTQTSGPFKFSVKNGELLSNGQAGLVLNNLNSADDASFSIEACESSLNLGPGFLIDNAPPALGAKRNTKKRACRAHANGGDGFLVLGTPVDISGCSASDNNGNGFGVVGQPFVLDGSTSQRNGGHGILLDGSGSFDPNGGVIGFRSDGNGGDGLHVIDCGVVSVDGSHFTQNAGSGVFTESVIVTSDGLYSVANGSHGVEAIASTWKCDDAVLSANAMDGFRGRETGRLWFVGVTMGENGFDGLNARSDLGQVIGAVTVQDCDLSGNVGNGLFIDDSVGGQVTGNSAFGNGLLGLQVNSTGHVLTGNVAGNNPGGNVFAFMPGNSVGPNAGAATIGADNNFANQNP